MERRAGIITVDQPRESLIGSPGTCMSQMHGTGGGPAICIGWEPARWIERAASSAEGEGERRARQG